MASAITWMASCKPRPKEEPKKRGAPGNDTWFEIRIDSKKFMLQLAVSDEEKATGLMHRKKLEERHGMLFLSEKPEKQSFWMKNTWIPLDIGFFDANGVLLEVRKLHPHEERSVKSTSNRVKLAIELNRNGYRLAGIGAGAKIELEDLKKALGERGMKPSDHGF